MSYCGGDRVGQGGRQVLVPTNRTCSKINAWKKSKLSVINIQSLFHTSRKEQNTQYKKRQIEKRPLQNGFFLKRGEKVKFCISLYIDHLSDDLRLQHKQYGGVSYPVM